MKNKISIQFYPKLDFSNKKKSQLLFFLNQNRKLKQLKKIAHTV